MAHGNVSERPHQDFDSTGQFTENKGVTLDTGYEIEPVSALPSEPATPVHRPNSADSSDSQE